MRKWLKKHLVNMILFGIVLIGLGLLAYPTFADWWNSLHQARAIQSYAAAVANLDREEYDRIIAEAEKYNQELSRTGSVWNMQEAQIREYNYQLAIDDSGIMGYIDIPKINIKLPLYHGTDERILNIAIGHIAGTSLPVGGEGTHCVLSGHRGLPSARLFTDIDQLGEGDTFVLRTLDETLTYQVDQIRIVLPYELDDLQILPGRDLCTLVTCTPYGVNTHRLLVRGHRVENAPEARQIRVTGDAFMIDSLVVAPLVALPMLLILFIALLVSSAKKRGRRKALDKLEVRTDESQ